MSTLIDIGGGLGQARRARALSQEALAREIGVKRQQVQRWEATGYQSASLARVSRAAEVLGVSVGGEPVPPIAAEAPATYGMADAAEPVRDLGEIVSRVRAHADELRDRFGVKRIDVFGSFARGEQTPTSDVDLIVEVEDPRMETVFGSQRRLGEILGRKTEAGSLTGINPRVRASVEEDLVHVWPT